MNHQPDDETGAGVTRILYGPAGIIAALAASDTSATPILAETLAAHPPADHDHESPEP